jgi:hypothetical protein
MRTAITRALSVGAAAIFGVGGVLHAAAYGRAGAGLAKSHVPPFLSSELRALWLADATTLVALAAICGYLALRPHAASRLLTVLLVAIPGGTTALVYNFLGPFYAAHLLLAACLMVIASVLLRPAKIVRTAEASPS